MVANNLMGYLPLPLNWFFLEDWVHAWMTSGVDTKLTFQQSETQHI